MKRNEIYTHEDQIYRILIVKEDNCLVIDCKNNTMPVWKPVTTFWDASIMTEEDLYTLLDFKPVRQLDELLDTRYAELVRHQINN